MKAALPHLLIIDDDDRLRGLLKKYLDENGFVTVSAENAQKAREAMEFLKFDLIILDVMMPGETGLQFLKTLRQSSEIPVLMLTAQAQADDRIQGLESGADDYLAKPFEPKELLLRIRSILKRQQGSAISFGRFSYDLKSNVLKSGESIIHLTSGEESLLKILAQKANSPLTREELVAALNDVNERAIDVQVNRLRKKLEDDPKKPIYIQTIRGSGYRLNLG